MRRPHSSLTKGSVNAKPGTREIQWKAMLYLIKPFLRRIHTCTKYNIRYIHSDAINKDDGASCEPLNRTFSNDVRWIKMAVIVWMVTKYNSFCMCGNCMSQIYATRACSDDQNDFVCERKDFQWLRYEFISNAKWMMKTFVRVGSPIIVAVDYMTLKFIDSREVWYDWHTIVAIAHKNRIKHVCLHHVCWQVLHRYLETDQYRDKR